MAKTEGFLEFYLDTVLADTAGITGMELIRRTDGLANVKDITGIPDETKRMRAERIIVTFAKECIMQREALKNGQDYIDSINKAIRKFS
ncbi:hypothetical protein [Sporomusa acidovorans]|uniref:5-deoxyribose kinase n=1 Tax=Sporomusa acidovorans (strain ATCC 49682 / DSM 3132 / Mol) TaxID=1123286 RepID=A0ABZ3J138_SPOA4|nr:hypothetical protein [Sporomusa acidovorans]OZC22807.1 methylthioribose kinase [Sporomusa acidovorans DSM 3132]SDE51530.1 5-methylthioribose kinase [Sporomusa acidovorans]